MIRSIAVTTDFSPFSRRPFGAAAALARRFETRLHVLHVVRDPEFFTPWQISGSSDEELDARRSMVQRRLESLTATEPTFEGLDVRPHAILGHTVGALCRFVEEEGIDLVVVASHGRTGAEHVLFGNFAAKVVQLVSCPVLVFREAVIEERRPWPEFEPRRILVPHDFSRSAVTGLSVARRWARHFDASIRLLYVVDSEDYDQHDQTGETAHQFFDRIREEGQQQLERLAREEDLELPGDAVVRMGHPAIEILKETDEFHADLVVMASRGLSDLERLHLGSVGERTIQGVSCPVLLVKNLTGSPEK